MDQTDSYPVKLYIYDLSRGMARQLSPLMLGKFLTSYLLVGFMTLDCGYSTHAWAMTFFSEIKLE